MVSASVSAAVSMMIGARDPGAAQQAADLAPVHVGQADIEEHGVETLLARDIEGALAGIGLAAVEGFHQAQLLGQRLAQRLVVVHQQETPVRRRAVHRSRGH